MSARRDDYLWVEDAYPALWEAYCFTLVQGTAPGDVLVRSGAVPASSAVGLTDMLLSGHDECPAGGQWLGVALTERSVFTGGVADLP